MQHIGACRIGEQDVAEIGIEEVGIAAVTTLNRFLAGARHKSGGALPADEPVRAAAVECVPAATGHQQIVAAAAIESFGTRATPNGGVTAAGEDHVIAASTVNLIDTTAAIDRGVAAATVDYARHGRRTTVSNINDVGASAGIINGISTRAAVDNCGPIAGRESVVARTAPDCVVACPAIDDCVAVTCPDAVVT